MQASAIEKKLFISKLDSRDSSLSQLSPFHFQRQNHSTMSEDTAPSPALQALMSSTRSTSTTTLPLDRARQKKPTTSNSATSQTSGPIPMSMPAILIQPKNKHLLGALGKKAFNNGDENASSTSSTRKGKESGIPGGRRRRRRWENGEPTTRSDSLIRKDFRV